MGELLAAWVLTVFLDNSRVYAFTLDGWVFASTPGIQLGVGPLSASFSQSYDRYGYIGNDFSVDFGQALTKRVDVSAGFARYGYPGFAADLTVSTRVSVRIR